MVSAQILVVEDEKITAKRLRRELEGMGYTVPAVVETGEEALRRAAETSPDLVLMDIVLPGDLDGIETTKRLRDRYRVPVVYLSSHEDDGTLDRARATEPYGYLIKPYEERELRATIEMALYKHQVEQCLRDTERWLTATLRSVNEAVVATDVMQRVAFMNRVAEELTGRVGEDTLGHELAQVVRLEGDGNKDLLDGVEAMAAQTGESAPIPQPAWLVAPVGQRTPVEGTLSPIRDDEGAFTGYVWVFRDVSERLAAQERLRRSTEEFRRTRQREAVSKLAGNIAHDFNNLLTVILGNTSLLLCQLPETDPNLRALLNIQSAALSAMDLVKRLHGYSRLTNPRQGPADLNVAAQRVWEELRPLMNVPVAVDFRPAAEVWPVEVAPDAVEEMLTNLGLNLVNAMPGGGRLNIETDNVTLTDEDLCGHSGRRAGEFVRLRVSDAAGGLAAVTRFRGTGTDEACVTIPGLQEVFESVEQCGGWIERGSHPRHGSYLDVYLPRARTQGPASPSKESVTTAGEPAPAVLLVDDEPLVRELGRAVLQRHGYRVLLAGDGAEAVELYRGEWQHIDLVILDLTMPELSGDDTLRRLSRINPKVRVLFCSGYPSERVKSLGHEQVVGFINKPFRNEELAGAVRAALESSPRQVVPMGGRG